MKIKVCGMRYAENISDLALLKPDYMGFIFYPPSKRFVGELDRSMMEQIPASIKKTGVFVNESAENICELIRKYSLDAVQLHGSELPETGFKIAETGAEIIKAFGVDDDFDFKVMEPWQEAAQYFLFDTKTKNHGGSGVSFNWKVLEQYPFSKPYFLSGGLGQDSLDEVLELNDEHFFAVDLNSCFETEPAVKDIQKLQSAINKLRSVKEVK